jgi:hypothetical protein
MDYLRDVKCLKKNPRVEHCKHYRKDVISDVTPNKIAIPIN